MRRSVGSGIVVLLALIVAVAVIASTQPADEPTELLKLLPNGLPDISGIQTQPPTKAQIRAQMKKDGLSIDLFKKVPPRLFFCLPFVRATTVFADGVSLLCSCLPFRLPCFISCVASPLRPAYAFPFLVRLRFDVLVYMPFPCLRVSRMMLPLPSPLASPLAL